MAIVNPFTPTTTDQLASPGENIPDWFDAFLHLYNVYGLSTSSALTGSLTLTDNIAGMRYPATGWLAMTTSAVYITKSSFAPITFTWNSQGVKAPDEVRIGYLAQQNGGIITTAVGTPRWIYNASTNQITVTFIAGLAASTAYYITFIAQ